MNLLKAYLAKPSTRKALSKKPGQEGFSLIELVVVIAVLAVLTAIALPNFLGVSDDAAARAAQQAVITAFKECQVHKARGVTLTTTGFESAPVNDFAITSLVNTTTSITAAVPIATPVPPATEGVATASLLCFDSTGGVNNFAAVPNTPGKFPKFMVAGTGVKSCTSGSSDAATLRTYNTGCTQVGTVTAGGYGTTSGTWK